MEFEDDLRYKLWGINAYSFRLNNLVRLAEF